MANMTKSLGILVSSKAVSKTGSNSSGRLSAHVAMHWRQPKWQKMGFNCISIAFERGSNALIYPPFNWAITLQFTSLDVEDTLPKDSVSRSIVINGRIKVGLH